MALEASLHSTTLLVKAGLLAFQLVWEGEMMTCAYCLGLIYGL